MSAVLKLTLRVRVSMLATYLNEPVQVTQASQNSAPTEERFLLKVDGQIKRSFSSKEAAAAGAVVKRLIRSWSLPL